ncbi:MAG: DUF294 nucleotidyltransferase-like domain-containing protein [Bacillota bacterium]
MENEIIKALKYCVPFNVLNEDSLSGLAEIVDRREYKSGMYVFRQGEDSLKALFIIVSGMGEMVVADEAGQEIIVSYCRQYDFFGETALLTDKPYVVSARASSDLTCLVIHREKIQELIANYPAFSGFFTSLLSERLRAQYQERASRQVYELSEKYRAPLLRKRVSQIMTRSPVTCRKQVHVSSVAALMAENRISSVVVVDENLLPIGLLTEKDLVHKILTGSTRQIEDLTAELVMDDQLVIIKETDFYNQALLKMVKHQVKHLVVMDGNLLTGILTIRDLIKASSTGSLWVADKIDASKNLDDLSRIGREAGSFLNALVAERATVPELFEIITEMHDRLTCRVIELCEAEMTLKGYGPPPVDYCWVNMGSAGRKEQTLRTDQDNAIIFSGQDSEHRGYFQILAARVVEELVKSGFDWCKGGTMASSPRWCRSLDVWKETVKVWSNRADPEDTASLAVLLDFRCVYGNKSLEGELRDFIFSIFGKPVRATHYLAEELQIRVPLTIFGGFATEKTGPKKNEINLKLICRHIISCVRLFAIKYGIPDTSTLDRLSAIAEKGILPGEDVDFIRNSFEFLMMLRIRENIKKANQGKEADNYINPYKLSKFEQSLIKNALSAITRLQKLTGSRFKYY